MSRKEKRHKFNEAVVNTLYPPQPKEEDLEVNNDNVGFASYPIPDDFEDTISSTSSDDDDDETGSGKLTRAQRKRLRRKKLKSDSSSKRRKIIGPLLAPQGITGSKGEIGNEAPSVRRNASLESPAITYKPGEGEGALCSEEVEACRNANKSKVKQRRKAKKLARESLSVDGDQTANPDQKRIVTKIGKRK